jgi:hypothetical protein
MQNEISAKLRSALVMEIFKKSLLLPHDEAKESAAVSLLSSEIGAIVDGVMKIFDIFAGIAEALVGVYLLQSFVQDGASIGLWTIGRKF